MDKSVFDRHHIHFDTEAKTQKEAFRVIAHEAFTAGFVKDENAYYEVCVLERKKLQQDFRMALPFLTVRMKPA